MNAAANTRAKLAALLLLSTGLLPAPASAQLVGACFDVTVGPWQPGPVVGDMESGATPPEAGEPTRTSEIPRRVLFTDSLTRGSRYTLSVPEGTLDTSHRWKVWRELGDSLELVLSTGFSGTTTRLGREGARWAGWSRTFTDNLPYRSLERPVTLHPANCADPSPQPASLDPPLPRRVDVEGLPPLQLGRPLPDLWAEILGESEWASEVVAAGVLARADSLRIRTTRGGIVRQVDLVYPADSDLSGLQGLLDELTTPEGPLWMNRTTHVMIRRFQFGRIVTLRDPRLDGR